MNDDVRRHLLRQTGTISRRQTLDSGLTSRQLDRLLRTRAWLPVHPAIGNQSGASTGSTPWCPPRRPVSAPPRSGSGRRPSCPTRVRPGGGGCRATHHQAWTFTSTRRSDQRPGVRVVQAFVDPGDRTVRRGGPVVSRPWAVLRAAAGREAGRPGDGIALLDRVAQTHVVRRLELERALARHAGCWGASTIRTLLRRTGDGAHSELERLAVSTPRRAGITGVEPNLTVRLGTGAAVEIDIAFPDRRIALELDGFAFHSGADAVRHDRRRGNSLMADGWTVRRFTWDDLLHDPEGFVR